jgi:hypothetical protein
LSFRITNAYIWSIALFNSVVVVDQVSAELYVTGGAAPIVVFVVTIITCFTEKLIYSSISAIRAQATSALSGRFIASDRGFRIVPWITLFSRVDITIPASLNAATVCTLGTKWIVTNSSSS